MSDTDEDTIKHVATMDELYVTLVHSEDNDYILEVSEDLQHSDEFTELAEFVESDEFDDILAHYGVKGMRWGHTKASDGSGGSGVAGNFKKKPTSDQVKVARENLQRQALDIRAAKRDARTTTGKDTVERAIKNQEIRQMKADFLNNPDRITATYLTNGEKVVMGIMATAGAPIGGTGSVIGNAAGRAYHRKLIAKKQATGAYDYR